VKRDVIAARMNSEIEEMYQTVETA
jgi:hypothetical protein